MNINKARTLKVGQLVYFPADRGSQGGFGYVRHVGETEQKNIYGTPYLWVTVRASGSKSAGVWPSNRLS